VPPPPSPPPSLNPPPIPLSEENELDEDRLLLLASKFDAATEVRLLKLWKLWNEE